MLACPPFKPTMVKKFLFAHWASNDLVTSSVGHCFGYGFQQAKSFVSIATECLFGLLGWMVSRWPVDWRARGALSALFERRPKCLEVGPNRGRPANSLIPP